MMGGDPARKCRPKTCKCGSAKPKAGRGQSHSLNPHLRCSLDLVFTPPFQNSDRSVYVEGCSSPLLPVSNVKYLAGTSGLNPFFISPLLIKISWSSRRLRDRAKPFFFTCCHATGENSTRFSLKGVKKKKDLALIYPPDI